MARPDPKSKKGGPVFNVYPHTLSHSARERLVELLCHDINNDNYDLDLVIADIELYLGMYNKLVQSLDNAPRPSDYIAVYTDIQNNTAKLLKSMSDLSMFYREQFDLAKQSLSLNETEKIIASIYEVSNTVIKKFKGTRTKGAPTNSALLKIIYNLREIFSKYYRGPNPGRTKQKPFENKSFKETSEIQFVETALLDAEIILKKDSRKKVERLFLDKRTIPK